MITCISVQVMSHIAYGECSNENSTQHLARVCKDIYAFAFVRHHSCILSELAGSFLMQLSVLTATTETTLAYRLPCCASNLIRYCDPTIATPFAADMTTSKHDLSQPRSSQGCVEFPDGTTGRWRSTPSTTYTTYTSKQARAMLARCKLTQASGWPHHSRTSRWPRREKL